MNNLDLTPYSNKELSLVVFNTQGLFSEMMRLIDSVNFKKEHLTNFLKNQGYKYTIAQWELLADDLIKHREETMTQRIIQQYEQLKGES